MLPILFAVTMFLSAALLFVVQPMVGKMLLPLAGGTPAVWTTCLVFFQAALLLGYVYADRLAGWRARLGVKVAAHAGVLAAGGLLLWAGGVLRPDPALIADDARYPVLGLTALLAVMVGMPFVVASATAPLLQKWFAAAGRADPYPLYAASNAGSLLGLVGYPFLIEPWLPTDGQRVAWAAGFVVVAALVAACGVGAVLVGKDSDLGERPGLTRPSSTPLPAGRVLRWVGLSALTSSLLMSVTAHLTTNIAPVPLLWVVPLGLYLASFILVFARWPERAHDLVGRAAPMGLCLVVVTLLTQATGPMALIVAVHLGAFFVVALLCHGELARDRPGGDRLTTFYLWMSVGGVLGGLFNAVAAPVLFSGLGMVEYPLAIVLAGLVRPRTQRPDSNRIQLGDWLAPLALGAATVGLVFAVRWALGPVPEDGAPNASVVRLVRSGLTFGLPAVVAFSLVWRPVRFALCLAAILLAGSVAPGPHGRTLLTSRNFFGTLRVTTDDEWVRLVHGTTQHGMQRVDAGGRPEPTMYYHRRGPVGRLFDGLDVRRAAAAAAGGGPAAAATPSRLKRIGVVGLGCGAMAAYAEPGQSWTFYEIDPAVERIARDDRFFTFLSACRARVEVVLGDARRQLLHAPAGGFDLLVLDAFSSDAIPVHLLTKEAFDLYAAKLAPGGVLAFHLSNNYLDLPPLVARLAADRADPFAVRADHDLVPSDADRKTGKLGSIWLAAARTEVDLGRLAADPANWAKVPPTAGPVWTDQFSNLLGVWKRNED